MAMPPTPAAAATAPDDPGAAQPADMAEPDAGNADEGAEQPVLFTVMGKPEGPYTLMAGDEPEGEGADAAAAPTFDTPQELMKAIMALLNPDKGAEEAFGAGFKGEPDTASAKGNTGSMPPA